eukprot:6208239-Pleurochrysis_carterae.AAC.2
MHWHLRHGVVQSRTRTCRRLINATKTCHKINIRHKLMIYFPEVLRCSTYVPLAVSVPGPASVVNTAAVASTQAQSAPPYRGGGDVQALRVRGASETLGQYDCLMFRA